MIKEELKNIFFRFLASLAIIGLIRICFDFSVIKPGIIVGVASIFGTIDLYYSKIDESEKVFEGLELNNYEKVIEINKALKFRAQYFRLYWWLSVASSFIVGILGLLLKYNPELIPNKEVAYFICFSLLIFNIPVLITFILAYFDSKEAAREIAEDKQEEKAYKE